MHDRRSKHALMRAGLTRFAARVAAGESDAGQGESEAWARSQTDPETIRIREAMASAQTDRRITDPPKRPESGGPGAPSEFGRSDGHGDVER